MNKVDVKLIWNTPDPEFQIVRAMRFIKGTMDETDSRWAQVGMKSGPDGKLIMSYPMFRVELGPKDITLLKDGYDSPTYFDGAEHVHAAFVISGLSKEWVARLKDEIFINALISEDGTSVQICGSFNDYLWALLNDKPCQLDLFEDDTQKPLSKLAKLLYELAPIVFEDYKDRL